MRLGVAVVVVSLLLASCTSSSDETPKTVESQGHAYQGSKGWSVRVPAGWKVLPFHTSKGDVSAFGAQISNVDLPPPEIQPGLPIQTSSLDLPPDGVSLIIATDLDPSLQVPPPAPARLPLSLEDFAEGSATGGGPTFSVLRFVVSGNVLVASIKTGSNADEAEVHALVASIRESD
jgi:hypothetical protein